MVVSPSILAESRPAGGPPAWRDPRVRIAALAQVARFLLVLLCVGGWWLSFDLLRLSGGLSATNPWLDRYCGGTPTDQASDCRSVLRSERASIALMPPSDGQRNEGPRLPWAAVGLAYFAFVGLWFLFVGAPSPARAAWHIIPLLVVSYGCVQSLGLTLSMANELHRWCAGCLAVHAVNAALLLLTLAAFPWARFGGRYRAARAAAATAAPDETELVVRLAQPRTRLVLATLSAGTLAGLFQLVLTLLVLTNQGAAALKDAYSKIIYDPAYARWRYSQQPVIEPLREAITADAGAPDAPNTVVAFIDFQCDACRLANEVLSGVLEKHAGKVRVVFKHYPQDPACNPRFAKSGGHATACRAARAAEAARVVGGNEAFVRMKSRMYQRQHDLELDPFLAWAKELAVDPGRFQRAMDSEAVAERVRQDVTLGEQIGVTSVPVLFLNGRKLEHWREPKTWDALLAPPSSAPAATTSAPSAP